MTTFSDKEIAVVANAIGWVFYGDLSEDGAIVEVPEEDSGKCIEAAKRALEHLEMYRTADPSEHNIQEEHIETQ